MMIKFDFKEDWYYCVDRAESCVRWGVWWDLSLCYIGPIKLLSGPGSQVRPSLSAVGELLMGYCGPTVMLIGNRTETELYPEMTDSTRSTVTFIPQLMERLWGNSWVNWARRGRIFKAIKWEIYFYIDIKSSPVQHCSKPVLIKI